ncbi:abnormal spindle-like microcephaly-associated protein [Thraustotheca clavata]|uniref:Abnormal spindle-like microcephaly-associated protein n=1 Tax=Thraustotheca clavata TaxID=74557 RepID=A0A1V9Z6P2_9STRA|nr:abnormal spindle-like microcephaly-associated protein [Thraustotheca clavata]
MDNALDKENRSIVVTLKRKASAMPAAAVGTPRKREPPAHNASFLLNNFQHVPLLEYGSVEIGSSKTLQVGLVNPSEFGVANVVVEDVVPKQFASEFYVDTHQIHVVPMQSSVLIDVIYTPKKPGRVHAKLYIRLNKRFRLFCTLQANASGTELALSTSSSKRQRSSVTSASSSLGSSVRKNKPETSTSQWWKKRRLIFDDKWVNKQEEGFQKWINFTLLGAHFEEIKDETPLTQDRYYQLRLLAIKRLESKIRHAAHSIYNNPQTDNVLYRLQREITAKQLTIRTDRPLHADLGLQEQLMELFNHYHPLWLTLALEVVLGLRLVESLGELIHPQSATARMPLFLRRLIAERIVNDPILALKYPSLHLGKFRSDAYLVKLRIHTLVKCFMIVYFLDKAHTHRHVDHVALPCLFRPTSPIKSSKRVLYDFCQRFLSQEGNVLRHLQNLEYTVSYEQSVLEEMDMQVENLATDLRDGVRLVRLVETLVPGATLSQKLRLPAVSRLQKVHNVQIALGYLQDECDFRLNSVESSCSVRNSTPTSIEAKDIVLGHREKTLALLWKLISHFKLSNVVDVDLLAAEIARVKRRWSSLAAQVYATVQDEGISTNNMSIPQLLLEWCRVVCANYHLAIHNFTASFADGKALCLMIHYYHPRLLEKSEMHWTTSDKSDQDRIGHDEFEQLLQQERANFTLANNKVKLLGQIPVLVPEFDSNNLPEEKIIMTFVAYLHSRLLGASREIHASFCLQHWWVPRFRRLRRVKRDKAARIIQRFWYTTSQNRFAIRCVQRLLYLVRKLQAFGRMVLCRSKYLRYLASKQPPSPARTLTPPKPRVVKRVHYEPPTPILVETSNNFIEEIEHNAFVEVENNAFEEDESKAFDEENNSAQDFEPEIDYDIAASIIQKAIRAWLQEVRASRAAFHRVVEEGRSAARIQQWWRGYRRIIHTRALWKAMTFHTRRLRESAAYVLQRWVRQRQLQSYWYALVFYARLQVRQEVGAITIQQWYRNILRQQQHEKTHDLWATMIVLLREKRHNVSCRIQRWWRRRIEIIAFEQIQAKWYDMANALSEQHTAATFVQTWWRTSCKQALRRQRWIDVIEWAKWQQYDEAAFVIQMSWKTSKKRRRLYTWQNLVHEVLNLHHNELWNTYQIASATLIQRFYQKYRNHCRILATRAVWLQLIEDAKRDVVSTTLATIRVQTWWRQCIHLWSHRQWWRDAAVALQYQDGAARRLQSWWRIRMRREQVREWFCSVIAALHAQQEELQSIEVSAIRIQTFWRRASRFFQVRQWWIDVTAALYQHELAAITIQTIWRRAQKLHQRREKWTALIYKIQEKMDFDNQNVAAHIIQSVWTRYRHQTVLRAWWVQLIGLAYEQEQVNQENLACRIQVWWRQVRYERAIRRQKEFELRSKQQLGAIILQNWWRTICYNRKLAATKSEWQELIVCLSIQHIEQQTSAAIVIQSAVRRYQLLQQTKYWWLNVVEYAKYYDHSARTIQVWYRTQKRRQQNKLVRRLSSSSSISHGEAIIKLQAWWRGTIVRRRYDRLSPVTAVRHRLDAAQTSAKVVAAALRDHKPLYVQEEKIKLRLRLKRALAVLNTSPRLQDMFHAVHTLEMCTRLSRECCVECLLHQVPRLLYGAIRKCNRSRPQLELLHQLLQVVLNLCLHQQHQQHHHIVHVPDDIEGHAMSCELWIDLMQMHRDSSVLFTLSARLLKYTIMCLLRDNEEYEGRQQSVLDEALRRLTLLHALMSKRALTKSMIEKHQPSKMKDGQLHPQRAASILLALLQSFPTV